MSNKILALPAILFLILSIIFFINTGSPFYAGLIFVNCAAVMCFLCRNRTLVNVFLILGLIGMIFTTYHGILYFSKIL